MQIVLLIIIDIDSIIISEIIIKLDNINLNRGAFNGQ